MKTLPKTFSAGGYLHEQLERDGRFAIYRRSKGDRRHYEVIEIISHNGYTIAGKYVEPAEVYPSSEKWGLLGWTCDSMGRACDKINELRGKPKRKKK